MERLDPKLNWDACLMIVSSVAKAPQSPNGTYLISDKLMKSYDSNYRGRKITLPQMALIAPPPEETLAAIRRVHDLFGIECNVTPEQAAFTTLAMARNALNNIKWITEEVSQQTDNPFTLADFALEIEPGYRIAHPEHATTLDQYLRAQVGVLEKVRQKIQAEAFPIGTSSKYRQQEVIDKHLSTRS